MSVKFPDTYHLEFQVIKTQYRDDGSIYDVTEVDTRKSHQVDGLEDVNNLLDIIRSFLNKNNKNELEKNR